MEGSVKPHHQEVRDGTPESIMAAHQIVAEELGDDFYLIYGGMPKNVGVLGDIGIYGDTVMICAHKRRPLVKFIKNPERVEHVSGRLCNESYAVTKVLIEATLLPKPKKLPRLRQLLGRLSARNTNC